MKTTQTTDVMTLEQISPGEPVLLIGHYNQVAPNAGYSESADFNGDGSNDITDLLLLIGNYNRQGDA